MDNAQLINQTSGNVEYYTPAHIIEAARSVMGRIDLDPASSSIANRTVQAQRYYTITDDGLKQKWFGNVWMNHPFGRRTNKPWIEKLRTEYEIGEVNQACCICFACTSEIWFQPLFGYPICFVSPRLNYMGPNDLIARGVTKGSCVVYLGPNADQFVAGFSALGRVKLPAAQKSGC